MKKTKKKYCFDRTQLLFGKPVPVKEQFLKKPKSYIFVSPKILVQKREHNSSKKKYSLEDFKYDMENGFLRNNFTYAWDQEELWKIAKNKKVIKYKMKDVKHWIYNQCWSKKDCYISIFQVFQQPHKFPKHIKRIKMLI